MKKRMFSTALILCMALTLLPARGLAAEGGGKSQTSITVSGSVPIVSDANGSPAVEVLCGDTITLTATADPSSGAGKWNWMVLASAPGKLQILPNAGGNSVTVQALKAGTAAVYVTYEDDAYTGKKIIQASPGKVGLSVALTAKDRPYDGTTDVELTPIVTGGVNGDAPTVTVTGKPEDAAAGQKTFDVTVDLDHEFRDRYTLGENGSVDTNSITQSVTMTIAKADPDVGTVSKSAPETIFTHTGLDGITLTKTGSAEGTLTLDAGQKLTLGENHYSWTFTPADIVNYNIKKGVIPLTAAESASKKIPTAFTVNDLTKIYDGTSFTGEQMKGTAVYEGAVKPVTWKFKEAPGPVDADDSGPWVVYYDSFEDDAAAYAGMETTVQVTITPADLPEASVIVAAPVTEAGKVLADVTLSKPAGWPAGVFTWTGSGAAPVVQGASYTWTFTPDSTNYRPKTGTVIPWAAPVETAPASPLNPGGGSSSSGSDSSSGPASKNPDGSSTQTQIRADGTRVEVTTQKNGDRTVVETKTDGSTVTTVSNRDGFRATIETSAQGGVEAAVTVKPSSSVVSLDIPSIRTTHDNAITVNTGTSAGTKVEVPVSGVSPGTVAVLIKADGTREIIKNSVPTENGIIAPVKNGETISIVDHSRSFSDMRSSGWAQDAVDFVAARGIFSGTSDSAFSPNSNLTRAQLIVALANYDGVDISGGSTWYEKGVAWAGDRGVSDGSAPDSDITREQLVTMIWHYAGSPSAQGGSGLFQFDDGGSVSGYARQALDWAIENGLINGMGDGSIAPQGPATRAQAAVIIRAFVEKQIK